MRDDVFARYAPLPVQFTWDEKAGEKETRMKKGTEEIPAWERRFIQTHPTLPQGALSHRRRGPVRQRKDRGRNARRSCTQWKAMYAP
jgi:hypothetical protein